jgi:hypothetical protein
LMGSLLVDRPQIEFPYSRVAWASALALRRYSRKTEC